MDTIQFIFFSLLIVFIYCFWSVEFHLTKELNNKILHLDKDPATLYFRIYFNSISLETYKIIKAYNSQINKNPKARSSFFLSAWYFFVQVLKIIPSVLLGVFLAPFFFILIIITLIFSVYCIIKFGIFITWH